MTQEKNQRKIKKANGHRHTSGKKESFRLTFCEVLCRRAKEKTSPDSDSRACPVTREL